MTEAAAHLLDNVFPRVPVRQWVISFPMRLRYLLAYDHQLCSKILTRFIRVVYRFYRWTAKYELGLNSVDDARCGSVTFIQRADSGLRLNLHFHVMAIDGVFVEEQHGPTRPTFYAMPAPSDQVVAQVAIAVRREVLRLLKEHGHDLGDPDAFDDFADAKA